MTRSRTALGGFRVRGAPAQDSPGNLLVETAPTNISSLTEYGGVSVYVHQCGIVGRLPASFRAGDRTEPKPGKTFHFMTALRYGEWGIKSPKAL